MIAPPAKTWIELSGEALRSNLRQASFAAHGAMIAPVVKANAYGHGLQEVCRALDGQTFPFLCVDSVEEVACIRAVFPQTPIVILGYVPRHQLATAVRYGAAFVVSKVDQLEGLRDLLMSRPAMIHIEIETGLHRQGADVAEQERLLEWLRAHPGRAVVEGLCTHLADAENVTSDIFVKEQVEVFREAVFRFAKEGIVPTYRHVACSAALWLHPGALFDVVRLGISLYGHWSSAELGQCLRDQGRDIPLQPVLSWKTLLAEIKQVPKGGTVGYGRTYAVDRPMRLGILPVGYADGFDRRLSGLGAVSIRGKRVPVVGRVCMNMCMVDLTGVPDASLEDEVVIFGGETLDGYTPEAWEQQDPTLFPYEVLARLRGDIPRVLVS
ncbi:alanine racemase [Patescibacteria group bacterium]|jgi:alanine racemase|nr:alanine racemase [Patescibacteria group bacterium]